MPIYEYLCHACHHQFDVLQKISDALVQTCPHCAAKDVARLVSAPGFQLKGGGWYATDFKTKPKKDSAPENTPSQSESAKKTGSDE